MQFLFLFLFFVFLDGEEREWIMIIACEERERVTKRDREKQLKKIKKINTLMK